MFPRIILVTIGVLSLAASHLDAEGVQNFPQKTAPILGWYSVPETELNLERFEEMVEMGLTHSLMSYSPEGNLKALDLADQVGLT
jgi:2'-5' RNA ligase